MKTRALPFLVLLIAILMVPAWSAAGPSGGGKGLVSFNKLKGKDIWGPGSKGKLLGAVEDIVATADGKSTFLVLSRGSAFGDVHPFRLIPWQMAAPQIEKRGVRISFDENVVEKSPAIQVKTWPPAAPLTPGSLEEVRAYYQQAMQGNR